MSIEGDLRTLLLTFSTVTSLVGTGAASRIRPLMLHQDDDETQPHVIIEVDDIDHANTLDGLGGRIYAQVTLRCRALELEDARSLAEAIRINGTNPGTGLAGYTGTVNGHTVDAVLEDEQTSYTPADDATDKGYYDIFANYVVTIAEAT